MTSSALGSYSVRRCSTRDAEAVAELAARLFAESYGPTHPEPELGRYLARSFSVKGIREAIESPEVTMLVVEDSEQRPIAYAYVRRNAERPEGVEGDRPIEIARFYVDEACHGRGVGAALMEKCFDDAATRGADVIWLQVWKEAPWAIGFYTRMGFTVVGSALFYFGEQIGHDHIMARPIQQR